MDVDCAICCALEEAKEALAKIVRHIDWSCAGTRKKNDFGLTKNHLMERIGEITKMQKWHDYFHSTGESLMETNSEINSNQQPKRWRKA